MDHSELSRAIQERNVRTITSAFFDSDRDQIRDGFKSETDLWDYKQYCPEASKALENKSSWSDVAAQILSFHNRDGGLIFFGVSNDFKVQRIRNRIDSKLFNDKVRQFIPANIWIEYHRILVSPDQSYVGMAIIASKRGSFERFVGESFPGGRYSFRKRESALREGDTCRIVSEDETDRLVLGLTMPVRPDYIVDRPHFRLLQPSYATFVARGQCNLLVERLDSPFAVISLVGSAGTGKTSLAIWTSIRAYESGQLDFIISTTAQDSLIGSGGILDVEPQLRGHKSLIDTCIKVLGFSDEKALPLPEKQRVVLGEMKTRRGLIVIDAFERTEEPDISRFILDLPSSVKVLTTSRAAPITASMTVRVDGLSDDEAVRFIRSLGAEPELGYLQNVDRGTLLKIGRACDQLPLAISLILHRAKSLEEALSVARQVNAPGGRGQVLEFCFHRVFQDLGAHDRELLNLFSAKLRPLSLKQIEMNLPDRSPVEIEEALSRLMRACLTNCSYSNDCVKFSISDLVRRYALAYRS